MEPSKNITFEIENIAKFGAYISLFGSKDIPECVPDNILISVLNPPWTYENIKREMVDTPFMVTGIDYYVTHAKQIRNELIIGDDSMVKPKVILPNYYFKNVPDCKEFHIGGNWLFQKNTFVGFILDANTTVTFNLKIGSQKV